VRTHHRKDEHWGNGPCEKYDASCAERTSGMLLWCEEQLEHEYVEDLAECQEHGNRKGCEEEARRAYRDQVLTCLSD